MSTNTPQRRRHVVLIVCGDVGRSPRMQYHTLSLLERNYDVSLIGYVGESVLDVLQTHPRLRLVRFAIPNPIQSIRRIRIIYFLWRVVAMALWLLWALLVRVPLLQKVDCFLVQNPPALPLLAVTYVVMWIKTILQHFRPGLIIDNHNLGFSMLNGKLLRRIARLYERRLAPLADAHFCVTSALKHYLIEDFGVSPHHLHVVHDGPTRIFQPLPLAQQHKILKQIDKELCEVAPRSWLTDKGPQDTLFTTDGGNGVIRPRRNRPALISSSTSWTPDEDFGILLDALVELDRKITAQHLDLRVVVVVTGKGPEKADYLQQISKLRLQNVAIQTLWLEPADYPRLLACVDLGVSLHTSTSGLDLPMKILDLYGCHVPVCAIQFDCLGELVQDGVNGQVFDDSSTLSDQLYELLHPLTFTSPTPTCHDFGALKKYAKNIPTTVKRWNDNWEAHALPVIERVIEERHSQCIRTIDGIEND